MRWTIGIGLVILGLVLGIAGGVLSQFGIDPPEPITEEQFWKATLAAGIIALAYGIYLLIARLLIHSSASKRRSHNVLNSLRLGLGIATAIAILALVTEQWFGLLFSLGIIGFAITFALQQPLFSLIGWLYIMVKRPYSVGDRVKIDTAQGDVIDVDYLVTTLWEIDGELVSSNQPSGRVVTLPNSTVLSTQVFNYSWQEFPYVWNEITFQVAYESDIEFARAELVTVADAYLGNEMAANIEQYRSVLAETPVELEVRERPSVNIVQRESWVELQLRYLVDPKNGQQVKNELYKRGLERFKEHPDRIGFPLGRSR